jgi:tRNA (guanine-N7-)-methyltransferase
MPKRMRMKKHLDGRIAACAALLPDKQTLSDTLREYAEQNEPLLLEIGCGKASFLIKTAADNPRALCVGVERISNVICSALEAAAGAALGNIRFLNIGAADLGAWLPPYCADIIYINFSDPWPKRRQEHNRLTADSFLALYASLLKADGHIELKTDNVPFFDYSIAQLQKNGWLCSGITYDLHSSPPKNNITTDYEDSFVKRGVKIGKLIAART